MPRPARILLIAALPLLLPGGCDKAPSPVANEAGDIATASSPAPAALAKADGSNAGAVTLSEDPNGVIIKIMATGLPAGTHGVHLHAAGQCDGPKFESAGPHWNPAGKKHGRDNPDGAHMGDLANLEIGADGSGSSTFAIGGTRLNDGANALADADGVSLVVHAKRDDYKTDPSGDSGERIACAVLKAS